MMAKNLIFINTNKQKGLGKWNMNENNESLNTPLFSISTAAKLLNISVHTLRMYEKEGLILPYKKETNHRLYSHSDIERIKCIRRAINESKISIAGIKTIYSLVPCYEIIKCPKENRNSCGAYSSHSSPCWTFNHKDYCEKLKCRDCVVYKNYFECKEIKESIISLFKEK